MTEQISPELHAYRLAHKLCTHCGGPRDLKRSLCSTCRNKVEREKQQLRRANRRGEQRCTHCGGPRDDEHLYCAACRNKIQARRREHYHRDVKTSRQRANEKHRKQRERRKLNPPAPQPTLTRRERNKIQSARVQAILDRLKLME